MREILCLTDYLKILTIWPNLDLRLSDKQKFSVINRFLKKKVLRTCSIISTYLLKYLIY